MEGNRMPYIFILSIDVLWKENRAGLCGKSRKNNEPGNRRDTGGCHCGYKILH